MPVSSEFTLGAAILGAGFMGQTYARTITDHVPGLDLKAVAIGSRAGTLAEEYGVALEPTLEALLARNDPRHIPLAAFFYAYLRTGAQVMERTTDVSRDVVLVIQALIILFVVAGQLLPPALPGKLRRFAARVKGAA